MLEEPHARPRPLHHQANHRNTVQDTIGSGSRREAVEMRVFGVSIYGKLLAELLQLCADDTTGLRAALDQGHIVLQYQQSSLMGIMLKSQTTQY